MKAVMVTGLIAQLLLLPGCSVGLSEAEVQSRIDKATASLRAEIQATKAELATLKSLSAPTASATAAPYSTSRRNSEVDDYLNQADLAFRDGDDKSACERVGNAISFAGMGAVPPDQAGQLRGYAQRCNLRY